jgi:phenylpyruvate tautomerase PptA (4-oxalocrotonate tautomerase family)
MPIIVLNLKKPLCDDQRLGLAEELTRISISILRKDRTATVVRIENPCEDGWFVNGRALTKQDCIVQLSITITRGSNTPEEKERWIEAAWRALSAHLDLSVNHPHYIAVVELEASDWGYCGLTQADRKRAAASLFEINALEGEMHKPLEDVVHPRDKILNLTLGEVKLPDLDFIEYQPDLRKNVLIHLLFDNTKDDPKGSDAAIIRYLPGAFVPRHMHMGYEMVLVLQGEYVENDVLHHPGSLIIRAPGTTHEMRSSLGCTILAMRDVPVKQIT